MSKKAWAITKLNLKNITSPCVTTGIIFITIFLQQCVYAIIMAAGGKASQLSPSAGVYLWLLAIMAAVHIPTKNFRRITNLGGKRDSFFAGGIVTLAVLSGLISVANTGYHYVIDGFFINTGKFLGYEAFIQDTSLIDGNYIVVNLIELFGWSSHGIFIAFIQQFAFLLLLSVSIYTLTAMQDKWYGWVTDAVIAAVLATFIPIAPLREWLLKFFDLIIFNTNAAIQITACMILSAAIYSLNKIVFARKLI
jgi:hypothetical protein